MMKFSLSKTLQTNNSASRKKRGFTLIELLITIAIVAILVQVAYSSYLNTIQQSYRYEAQQSMIELSQQLERYYSRNGVYSGSSATASNYSSTQYTLAFSTLEDDEFTISATPMGGQTSDDCSTLTLDYLGNKTPSTLGCWK
ncbi:type IV pilin protein [Psychromonas sp. SP041]|uniref:type IV pilin protein n=1 Tax=Psychromonas sp. SP041 TaxID=1365007 RepID=UPI0003F92963|nr:type IV pilin protein [Psychromonas sp. SP041]